MLIVIQSIIVYIVCILTIIFTSETLCVKEVPPKEKEEQVKKEIKNKVSTIGYSIGTGLLMLGSVISLVYLLSISRKDIVMYITYSTTAIGLNVFSCVFSTLTANQGYQNSDNCEKNEENEEIKTKVNVMQYISGISILFVLVSYLFLK